MLLPVYQSLWLWNGSDCLMLASGTCHLSRARHVWIFYQMSPKRRVWIFYDLGEKVGGGKKGALTQPTEVEAVNMQPQHSFF
jgi:hypothetical protein